MQVQNSISQSIDVYECLSKYKILKFDYIYIVISFCYFIILYSITFKSIHLF